MSDFLFSTQNLNFSKMKRLLRLIYNKEDFLIHHFKGRWGSLVISENIYKGFEPYENQSYIACVIGGPLLRFQNNKFLAASECINEGTKAILKRWQSGNMQWDRDLSGPFIILIINKKTKKVLCVTDMMSFIPAYIYKMKDGVAISSHVDILASIYNQTSKIDLVSELDFILHGIVTYPYTTYKNIHQIQAASEHTILPKFPLMIKSVNYWLPVELECSISLVEMSNKLRDSIAKYIVKVTKNTKNIAQFISAGEDSRLIASLLQFLPNRDAFIFLDNMNREGRIAKKIINTYGGNFKLFTRDTLHYLDILERTSDLVGNGAQYYHAHTYGFHEKCQLREYDAVFGGLLADALLKGSHIKKIKRTGILPFIPEIKDNAYSASLDITNNIFNRDMLTRLSQRRRAHLSYIQEFRSDSAEEWFELWPSSMNRNMANFYANRRLFRSYEPFMSNDVVKISAIVPQKWKLNRKLFQKMARPLLKETKWIPHGEGWFPYFSWIPRSLSIFFSILIRKASQMLMSNEKNQGPWGDWNKILTNNLFYNRINQYSEAFNVIESIFNVNNIHELIYSGNLTWRQKINILQTLYMRYKQKEY